ncbi:hypothetical protein QCE62_09625 [Caballeronia sp. LZ033]|uniref:hypothetical protein n=1 Tax=Caballeronia sp. LZ033 TaxID=3038566 RepID=UPI00285D312A|nr:hypothetical protein [Caballeronia sp. LZ033]MDR5813844.1 hypothetical protein [Caballeronia sp. LZ033]
MLIDSDFATIVVENVRAAKERNGAKKVVNDLRAHIAKQLLSAKYKGVEVHARRAKRDKTSSDINPIQLRGLFEFLQSEPVSNGVFACDDRFVTGYPSFGSAPVVGIYELLRALRISHALSDEGYFEKLLQLRSANVMFLPVEADEVLFHLKRAPIVEEEVVETQALAVLRRYLARVGLQERRLKVGEFPAIKSDRPDEINVFISTRRLTDECLTKVWSSKSHSEEQSVAWATWIWSQLRMERPMGEHPSIKRDHDSLATFTAVTFSAALSIIVNLAVGHSDARRDAYAKWLGDRVIKNRFHADHLLAEHLVAQFAMLLDGVVAPEAPRRDEQYSNDIVAAYLVEALDLVPADLRERLFQDSKLRLSLVNRVIQVIEIGGIQLPRDRFIPAISRAIQRGTSRVNARDSIATVSFRRIAPAGSIEIKHKGKSAQIHDRAFLLFECETEGESRQFLNDQAEWFDCSQTERESCIESIVALKSETERYEAVDEVRRQTLPFRFQDIENQLDSKHSVPLEQCTPATPEQVFRHLRLDAGSSPFSERWDRAAEALLTEYDLSETFLRLGGLPVPLPRVFVDQFLASPPEVQRTLYARFAELGARSPLHFLHALSLVKSEKLPSYIRELGMRMTDDVLSRWNGLADSLGTLMMWSDSHAHELENWRDNTFEEQLVTNWYHASRLMCTLNRNLGMETQIREHFAKARGVTPADAGFGGLTRSMDCAAPSNFVGVVLLYSGMTYALRGPEGKSLLSAAQQDQVTALTKVNNQVNPWLFASRELAPNCLDSFLRVDSALEPGPISLPLTLSNDFEIELIQAFEVDPDNPMLWVHLHTLARMGLSAANHQRFTEIVSKARITSLVGIGTEVIMAWRCIAGCVRLFGDADNQKSFREQLLQLAGALNDRYKTKETPINLDKEDERAIRLNELLVTCMTISRSDDVAQAFSDVTDLFVEVAVAWRAARTTIFKTLEAVYEQSRIIDSGAAWNALVKLRSMI